MTRKVLRFFTRADGMPFVIHYYLADDTVEIRECITPMMVETPLLSS